MEILQNFGVQPVLLIAQIVNFLILLFILRFILYKPIIKMLEDRKKRVADSMKNADEIEKRLAKLEQERDDVLKKAQAEADRMVKETKTETAELLANAQAQAKDQAAAMIEKARAQNTAELNQMRQALKGEIAELVTEVAQKAVADVLTHEQKEAITKQAAKEITS